MRAGILLLIIFITSGCVQTGEFIENKTTETTTKEITDPCEGILCEDSVISCEDGFVAPCSNFCENGFCSNCIPDCTGHDCLEEWFCTDWSSCSARKQTRTCNDINFCGTEINKPAEIQECVNEENIMIEDIHYESPEWVRIANTGTIAVDIGSWSLNDEAGHIYIFPIAFILGPHASVLVHTEKGSDTETDLYMNRGSPIWNNDGDRATLRNEKGSIIDEYLYPLEKATTTTTTITTTTIITTSTTIPEETTTTVPETTTTIPETTTTISEETTTTILGETLYVTVDTDKEVVVRGNPVSITTYVTDGENPVDSAGVDVIITYASGSTADNSGMTSDGVFVWEKAIGGNSKPGIFSVESIASKDGYESGSGTTNFEVIAAS